MAPYSFLAACELVPKSRDGTSFKKSTRKSRAIKRNKMSTNVATKFVKKKFWNSCASLFRFQNIYRTNKRHCPSVLNTKEKSARFAGTSINLYDRHANYSHGAKQRSLLPHVFAVFGVVCGGNSNENENSAKSGISQDVTTPVRTTSRQRAHGARMVLWKNETTKEHWSHERGVKILETPRDSDSEC